MAKILIEQRTKPGSKAAMRIALESIADYIDSQQSLDRNHVFVGRHNWWRIEEDTIREINYALERVNE